MLTPQHFIFIVAILVVTASTEASVVAYTNKAAWQAAAGPYSAITFTELPINTLITNQYSSLGVHFTDGSDYVHAVDSFITDGVGVNGAFDSTTLEFDAPIQSIAIDFPGSAAIQLYSKGQLFYSSPMFGIGGVGFFGGLISTQPFDKARLFDPLGGFFADNLYVSTIPAPGIFGFLAASALFFRARRRSS